MLQIKNLTKNYGELKVLNIVEMHLGTGCYWIRGANGSGKSTLFKALAGIIPFEGSVLCNEVNIRTHPVAYRRLVNFSPSEPAYPDFVTPNDLITFTAATKGTEVGAMLRLMERLGMTHALEQATGSFSSGMLKKTSLVLSMAGDPTLVLLDEPFSTLDHDSSIILSELIAEKQKAGVSFLFSSHIEEDMGVNYTEEFTLQKGSLV